MQCYCDTGEPYEVCCKPLIEGTETPSSSVELMRSRFTAFATKQCDYIQATQASVFNTLSPQALCEELKFQEFVELEVVRFSEYQVEFIARILEGKTLITMHEVSLFEEYNGRLIYKEALQHNVASRKLEKRERKAYVKRR